MNSKTSPRKTPNRDEKYMGLCFWYASFSKDPHTQHGAFVVYDNNYPLGAGYNGPPRSVIDNDLDWGRPQKYPYMVHAEINAMNHSNQDCLNSSTIYVTGLPCPSCMLEIANRGLSKVIYFDRAYDSKSTCSDNKQRDLSFDIAKRNNVKVIRFEGNLSWMRDRLIWMEQQGIFE